MHLLLLILKLILFFILDKYFLLLVVVTIFATVDRKLRISFRQEKKINNETKTKKNSKR